jgi:hypothetical protein
MFESDRRTDYAYGDLASKATPRRTEMLQNLLRLATPHAPGGETHRTAPLRHVTRACGRYAERYIPDSFFHSSQHKKGPHMKHSEQCLSEARRRHTEALVARHVHALFQRLPMLSGFWLRADLQVAELSVFSWPGYTAGQDLYEEVTQSLVDLTEERPEAVHFMRGRTFARALH